LDHADNLPKNYRPTGLGNT